MDDGRHGRFRFTSRQCQPGAISGRRTRRVRWEDVAMQAAAILFGIAALGGLAMAFMRWSGAPRPPDWLAMLHGLLAAAGLTLLIRAAVTVGLPTLALGSLCLFVLAALGGAYVNLRFHARQLALPKAWIVGHAALAVIAYALLLLALFGS
jgi:hypothetical protein